MVHLTEDQIERRVEGKFNRLDSWLMQGIITQGEYDGMAQEITQWAALHYRIAERAKSVRMFSMWGQ